MTLRLAAIAVVVAASIQSTAETRVDLRGAQAAARPAWTADALLARVLSVRKAERFRIRATMTRSTPGASTTDARQLMIKGMRDQASSIVLYQQLWPVVPGGLALVVEDAGDHRLKGFLYQSGRATPLVNGMLGDRFFGSDLTIEDLAAGCWFWPSRAISGQAAIGEYNTTIVDLRPGPQTPTQFSLVKAWLSPELAIGLRLEQYGRDGRLAKRIELYRLLNVNSRWMPGIITVEPADGRSRTVIEGAKMEQDVPVTPSDFTVSAIQKIVSATK